MSDFDFYMTPGGWKVIDSVYMRLQESCFEMEVWLDKDIVMFFSPAKEGGFIRVTGPGNWIVA